MILLLFFCCCCVLVVVVAAALTVSCEDFSAGFLKKGGAAENKLTALGQIQQFLKVGVLCDHTSCTNCHYLGDLMVYTIS